MKTVTTSKGTFLFVEVPDGICHTDLVYYGTMPAIEFRVISTQNIGCVELPRGGNYRFISTTKNAIEEHAAMVVEFLEFVDYGEGDKLINQFYNYEYPTYDTHFDDAIDSLKSLATSEGLNPKNNYAIIQKL